MGISINPFRFIPDQSPGTFVRNVPPDLEGQRITESFINIIFLIGKAFPSIILIKIENLLY